MTFQQDIDQLSQLNKTPADPVDLDYWDRFRGKPFYCQDYSDHYYEITDKEAEDFKRSECCTTHMMGLPVKDGKFHPLYDYQKLLIDLEKKFHNLIDDKSTGIGDSELKLRHKAHLAINDKSWENGQAIVFTGPRLALAVTLIDRMKSLFPDLKQRSKETVFDVYKTRFEAYPSHHTETARGLPNVVYMLTDEFDFFPPGQQLEVMAVQQRYMAKGNPLTNGVSTPNLPGGLLETEERSELNTVVRFSVDENYKNLELVYEQEVDDPLYCFIKLPYQIGMGRIYNIDQIIKAQQAPSFPREYELKYGYGVGDIFQGVDNIITDEYDLEPQMGRKCLAGDPAFGSSNFGICGGEQLDSLLYVKDAKQYPRPSPSAMLDVMINLAHRYDENVKIDGAHPGFIRDMNERGIGAMPVNFGLQIRDTENNTVQSLRSKMTINAAQMVKNKLVRIHPMFKDLISQLRAAQFDDKGGVDKKELNFDIGDAFIMMCWDLKEFDYTSYAVSVDGGMYGDEKPISKSVTMNVEVVE
jgi:hypothetical protein